MNKKELISKIGEVLRVNNIKKHVTVPKHKFHITDDDGNESDFTVRKTDKVLAYNVDDITYVLDACLVIIEDALKRGEEITIHGFGNLGLHYRAPRKCIHPETNEWCEVKGRYVPKFTYGNVLREAANYYNMTLEGDEE